MGLLDLVQRLRARMRRRRKTPKAQVPAVQTWEDFNQPDMDELMADARQQVEEAYEELQQSFRNPN